jgi:hypothetical protein
MQKPKMILFDYGHTLLCEPGVDFLRAVSIYSESRIPCCLNSR